MLIFTAVLGFASCKNQNAKESPKLNEYIYQVDSISTLYTNTYNRTLSAIYTVSEDSLLADSLSKVITIPDTLLFYQYLDVELNRINEEYYIVHQEILFAQDQLNGLNEDISKKQVSDVQLKIQLESHYKMILVLQERIKVSLNKFNKKTNKFSPKKNIDE